MEISFFKVTQKKKTDLNNYLNPYYPSILDPANVYYPPAHVVIKKKKGCGTLRKSITTRQPSNGLERKTLNRIDKINKMVWNYKEDGDYNTTANETTTWMERVGYAGQKKIENGKQKRGFTIFDLYAEKREYRLESLKKTPHYQKYNTGCKFRERERKVVSLRIG